MCTRGDVQRAHWGEIEAVIHSLNYFYNTGIAPGAGFSYDVKMGSRKYLSETDTDGTVVMGEEYSNLYLTVPDLAIFADYDEANEIFEDIFKADESATRIDVMGESENYGTYEETDENGDSVWKEAFNKKCARH